MTNETINLHSQNHQMALIKDVREPASPHCAVYTGQDTAPPWSPKWRIVYISRGKFLLLNDGWNVKVLVFDFGFTLW